MHRKTQLERDLMNNPRLFREVFDAVKVALDPCIKVSNNNNAKYTREDFHRSITHGTIFRGQVAGCTESLSSIAMNNGDSRPSSEWIRLAALRSEQGDILNAFENLVKQQLQEIKIVDINKPLDLAIDMHLIPRYDKKHGSELVRSKHKNGTHLFEKYITIQCVVEKTRLVLGVLHMPALENNVDFVNKIIETARRAGVTIGTIMLDREFYATDVISLLNTLDIGYLIPRKRTDISVAEIDEYLSKTRDKISKSTISSTTQTAEFYSIITEKKKIGKKDKLPNQKYISFATNRPDVDVDDYDSRWGIETGYRMQENARAKTHSKNPVVRLLFFIYSTAIFNAWVMANAILLYRTGRITKDPVITQQHLKYMLLFLTLDIFPTDPPPPLSS